MRQGVRSKEEKSTFSTKMSTLGGQQVTASSHLSGSRRCKSQTVSTRSDAKFAPQTSGVIQGLVLNVPQKVFQTSSEHLEVSTTLLCDSKTARNIPQFEKSSLDVYFYVGPEHYLLQTRLLQLQSTVDHCFRTTRELGLRASPLGTPRAGARTGR